MWTLVALLLICSLGTFLARPHRPRPGTEVEDLLYARLLGPQKRLVLFACSASVASLFVLVLALPRHSDGSRDAERRPPQVCVDLVGNGTSTCYTRQPDGMWKMEELRADGKRNPLGNVAESPTKEGPALHIP